MNDYFIPGSILVAGAMIAGAIVFTSSNHNIGQVAINNQGNPQPAQREDFAPEPKVELTPELVNITDADHRKGSSNPKISIVEYSDLDCPFCTRFHNTMEQVLDEYGDDVEWIYRHFPLEAIHPEAATKALASECVATQLGNDSFWLYIDTIFKDKTPVSGLQPLAESLGADGSVFAQCMEGNNAEEQRVADHTQSAIATGGQGTPWSLVVTESGEVYPINGAQPFSAVRAVIEANL